MAKSKTPSDFPAPEHRLNVILEELQSQFRTFGEGLTDVQEKVSKIEEIIQDIPPMKEDLKLIKSILPTLATKKDLEKLEKRLTTLETH